MQDVSLYWCLYRPHVAMFSKVQEGELQRQTLTTLDTHRCILQTLSTFGVYFC